ncbi:hypothetical protein ABZP36_034158 [Zizania latifolia]
MLLEKLLIGYIVKMVQVLQNLLLCAINYKWSLKQSNSSFDIMGIDHVYRYSYNFHEPCSKIQSTNALWQTTLIKGDLCIAVPLILIALTSCSSERRAHSYSNHAN